MCRATRFFGPPADALGESRGAGEPYDGVAEIWIDFDVTPDDPEATAAAMQRLLEDELTFVDMAGSSIFFTEERIIF
jgi:hypothetical protein